MTERESKTATVLVVEDEEELVQLFRIWLDDRYTVLTANSGEEALDVLDETVDVVLLDRRMPGLSGDEVLARIRAREVACRIVMVTAVVPDYDVIEMGFDEYLVKPIKKAALLDAVERMLSRNEYDDLLQELASLAAKRAVLRSGKQHDELLENAEYRALEDRIAKLKDQTDTMLEEDEDLDFDTLL